MTNEVKEWHVSPAGYAVGYTSDATGTHLTTVEKVDATLLERSRPLHRPERQSPTRITHEEFRAKFAGQQPPDAWLNDVED